MSATARLPVVLAALIAAVLSLAAPTQHAVQAAESVTRIAGADRYATAAAISSRTFAPGVPVAYVAAGTNYPDALAAAPAAARHAGPLLLVRPDSVPAVVATELRRLAPGRIVVAGGPTMVSDAVLGSLGQLATNVHEAPASPTPTASPLDATAPIGPAIHVAPTGSDTNLGTPDAPIRTPAHAAAVASPGTTVYLHAGTYPGWDVTRSGLTFAAYPGESAVISDATRDDIIEFSGVTSGALRDLTVLGSATAYGSAVKIKDSAGVTIAGSTIRDSRTWGVVVVRSTGVVIENNDISRTANAIEERYASDLVIRGNRLHDNTTMVDTGRGRQGINFYKSTGAVSVIGNQLWNNGTHFEVYGASNLTFVDNLTWNGQVMETGTTDGYACDNLRFLRNVGIRGTPLDAEGANGMILRCASNTLVAHNVFDGFDQFAFDIVDGTLGTPYGGSIAGLRVLDNVVVGGRAYSIDTALPPSVQLDYNVVDNTGSTARYGNYVAYVAGHGNFDSLAAFSAATGYETHGLQADPRFVDRTARDYRLQPDSPAIDRGTPLAGISFSGSAPDIGAFETR